jgi:lipopolysaccharide export LptBFGC system permease protein LptF
VQVLTLENGQRLEYSPQDDGMVLKVSEFSRYTIEVAQSRSAVGVAGGLKARSTRDLIADPNRANLGELGWRIGLVLTAINFVLLAVAVSAGNPRAGKSGNLLFMLFAFVFYYNFLTLGQSWVASGKVALLPFMLTLHGGVMGLSLLWLGKRHYNWRGGRAGPVRSHQGGRMKTLRRLIFGEMLVAIGFVLLAFLALFFFFDLADELSAIGRAAPASPTRCTACRRPCCTWACCCPAGCTNCCPLRC